jgi:hypothetical protein
MLAVAVGQAQQGSFRVVRAESGSKEEVRGGDFVISDPRTEFKFPDDKQVIVLFEWSGPVGLHRFQGTWRSPDGQVFSVSDYQEEVKVSPFQSHWTLTLPESPVFGMWELEAQIDGQRSGAYSFRILSKAKEVPVNHDLMGAIYLKISDAMVFIESLDKDGVRLNRGSGFFIGPNLVLTAFENIEGASALQIEVPGGERKKLVEVAAWNRSADWALLQVDAKNSKELQIAKLGVWKEGTTDYLIDAPQEGGRTVRGIEINGIRNAAGTSKRVYISWVGDNQSVGSPLLNQDGQVIGMLGGTPVEGVGFTFGKKAFVATQPGAAGGRASLMVVPISEVGRLPPPIKSTTLAEMAAQGLFAGPVAHDPQVIAASLCAEFQSDPKRGPVCKSIRGEVSRKQQSLTLMVIWSFERDQKLVEESQIFDSENHKVGGSSAREIKLKRGGPNLSDDKVSIGTLQPGVYRLDVLAGGTAQLRMNFIVME